MKKLTFDKLQIELTRKCNMKCSHCFRGDAQDVELSYEDIDALIEQTDMIHYLYLTGGEPSICLDKMEYLLNKMTENDVFLGHLEITTNGKEQSKEFIRIIKRYYEYIKTFYIPVFGDDVDITNQVIISVSTDRYHVGYNKLDSYYFYKVNLHGYATVKDRKAGNNPINEGRAKNLDEAFNDLANIVQPQRIEILSKNEKPICPNYRDFKLNYADQILICCELYVNARGNLVNTILTNTDYAKADSYEICSVHDDIYERLKEYNKDLPLCVDCERERASKEKKLGEQMITTMLLSQNAIGKFKNLMDSIVEAVANNEIDYNLFLQSSAVDFDSIKEESIARNYEV